MREKPVARMSSAASPTVVVSGASIMSTRGTMISRATVSPSSKISWIMRFSSSSSDPCSVTRSLISSSETPGRPPLLFMPMSRETTLVETVSSHTIGANARSSHSTGAATTIATRSARWSPMRLGTSSPKISER